MASRKTPRLINRPTQQRSRDTQDAILRAFRQALAATPYDKISIADLARRAGVSVGGFYARFASKDTLLLPLVEDTIAEFEAKLAHALDEVERKDGDLEAVASAYTRVMVTEFRRHGRVLQQVARNARGDVGAAIGERVHAFNVLAHERFRTLVWARRKEITHKSPRAAIEVALFMASASAREAVNGDNWRSYAVHPDETVIIREITASVVAYLTGKE